MASAVARCLINFSQQRIPLEETSDARSENSVKRCAKP